MTVTVALSLADILLYIIYALLIVFLIFAIVLFAKFIGIAGDVRKSTKTINKHVQILDKKVMGVYKTIDKVLSFFPDLIKKIKEWFADRKKKKEEAKNPEANPAGTE
jgi:hypothetical protein